MITFDMKEVRRLEADIKSLQTEIKLEARSRIAESAARIEQDLRADMAASKHFKGITRGITHEILDGGFTAHIGPEKGRPGSLANIAYFGGANGGGGTRQDPQLALEREAPRFQDTLLQLAARL